ncbi:transcription termination/antitermination protein NusG [Serpentinicella alkaliphila]|uniref:Transcription termination/antitermination protein NusG n=1 Tax=Serpentinicella alkaliphila TaxID=1734049 RepID=A0A4R2T1D4_9FIRM|nr:transcription termination/antitermination protein NusG [Serpentinicella alkaliphila]QUH25426.1 transcription termination/antitermination protein NusG [Serpentinicella alkaliphila]TCP95930.1 transcription antitermination protein nusG [Serpentinicella alkaliphila]
MSQQQAKWYVVHTYSGHENKVKTNIEKIVENRGMDDVILEVKVPTEERVEIKNGKKKIKETKLYPGYVIVKMIMTDESWYLVRNTRGVTGFVGPSSKPIPLTDAEVRAMGVEVIRQEVYIKRGDSVRVISGPFESFVGTVENVSLEKQTFKVRISMFGRETPVELGFDQVVSI